MNLESSYASASVFPRKVIRRAREFFVGGKLYPYHGQISLTNRCNLDCGFCSCSDRDKGAELSLAKAQNIMFQFQLLGMKALTITGGGEPILHPQFDEFVIFVNKLEISMGLVTNGLALGTVPVSTLSKLVWCRVSASDESCLDSLFPKVEEAVSSSPGVDWAYSYVVTENYDPHKVMEVVKHMDQLGMKHARLVTDILDDKKSAVMDILKNRIREAGIDDSKVIYQDRKIFTEGNARCLLSLVKPVIGTDGQIYPCCGVQYARQDLSKNFDIKMSMGSDISHIWQGQRYFDGGDCDKCYYSSYNEVLGIIVDGLEHEEFI